MNNFEDSSGGGIGKLQTAEEQKASGPKIIKKDKQETAVEEVI